MLTDWVSACDEKQFREPPESTTSQQAVKTTYIALLNYTDQGIRNLKQSPQRAQAFRQTAEAAGIKVIAQLWTAGACDGVLILEADNEAKVLGSLASLASSGNVRTQSLRAFDAAEFGAIVGM
jgi:uncharacterized protein with GYD domain